MTRSEQTTIGALSPLPVEIHLSIIDYLGYSARIALAYTNRYFNEMVVRQPPTTREGKLEYVCEAETWPMFVYTVKISVLLVFIGLTKPADIPSSTTWHATNVSSSARSMPLQINKLEANGLEATQKTTVASVFDVGFTSTSTCQVTSYLLINQALRMLTAAASPFVGAVNSTGVALTV